jgi:hypothetical protein
MRRIAVYLMGISAFLSTPIVIAETSFVLSTIETGVSVEQTLAAGFLRRADSADIIVTTVTEDKIRRLRVYGADVAGEYETEAIVDVALPEDVVLVDTGRLGNRDIIVLFTRDRAIHYDPFNDTVHSLATFDTIFRNAVPGSLPRLNLFRDINDDGLDDLVIPGFDGYQVILQTENRTFAPAIELHAPPVMDLSFDNYPWYKPRMLFHADLTMDEQDDIAFWLDDRFIVYPRLEDGTYSSEPRYLLPNVVFDFDGIEGVSINLRDEDQSNLKTKLLYQLRDLDGDKITDLVTLTLTSEGVFKKQTTYSIHRGMKGPDGALRFSDAPVSEIRSNGIQFEMEEKDLNRDGTIDIVVSSVQLGVTKIIGALITGSIDFDLDFYQMQEGRYADKPNVSRQVTATFDLSSGDFFFPFVLIADVNGDPFADLLVQDGESTLLVYEGEGNGRLFSKSARKFEIDLPNDPDFVQLFDVNNDGKQDVLMRIEKKNKSNRVAVLVSG